MKLKELLEIATVPDRCELIHSDCDGLCIALPDYSHTKRLHMDVSGIYVVDHSGRKYYFKSKIKTTKLEV